MERSRKENAKLHNETEAKVFPLEKRLDSYETDRFAADHSAPSAFTKRRKHSIPQSQPKKVLSR